MSTQKISIAILDDHPIVVEGIRMLLLQYNPDFEVYTLKALRLFFTFMESKAHLDVLLLDINLPDGNGLNICKELSNKTLQ